MDGLSLSATVLFIGHSLVNHTLPWMLEFVVASQGGGRHVEEQIINGAPLAWNWDHSAEAENGVDARAILPRGAVDVVVMTEAVPLVNHTTWSELNRYALAFYELATDANPAVRVYLYETWHSIDSGTGVDVPYDEEDAVPWRQRLDQDRARWEGIADHVNANRDPGAPAMLIVPAGQALARLHDAIAAGEVPGLADIRELFVDDIHLNDRGNYFVAMVQYATLYRRSPEGLPSRIANEWGGGLDTPAPALARAMQAIAWQAVTAYPRSGVAGG